LRKRKPGIAVVCWIGEWCEYEKADGKEEANGAVLNVVAKEKRQCSDASRKVAAASRRKGSCKALSS
jgi:hypothetical protein